MPAIARSVRPARSRARRRHRRPPRAAGFTLVEVLVSFVVLTLVLGAVLLLFNMNNRLAKTQTHMADMQQSLRVAQYDLVRNLRMAGRGGLQRGDLPTGPSISIRNDVPDSGNDHFIAVGDATSPEVLAGTDVVTVRGVLNSPIYQISPDAGNWVLDDPPDGGTIRLQDPNPNTGIPQDLQPLADLIQATTPPAEAFLVTSRLTDEVHAVLEFDQGRSSVTTAGGKPVEVVIGFKTNGTYSAAYRGLSTAYIGGTLQLPNVGFVGILEEYRFYVREAYSIPNDETSELQPRLARARFYPGTEIAYAGNNLNLQADIADGILDLQAVFGIDVDDDDVIEDDADPTADEWLFNASGDDPTDTATWNGGASDSPRLFYVRVTTLARTSRPDPQFVSPPIDAIEDHDYSEPADPGTNLDDLIPRRYRRRMLETLVDMRNL